MWVDVQQNTEEWFQLRLGKATASNFAKIMANYGKAFGNTAVEYAQKLATERVTKQRDERGFKGKYFDDGHELEMIARHLYEEKIMEREFLEVTNGGFYHNGSLGDSNDGNVGQNGCIEIKSVIQNTHWKRLKKKDYDTAYKWQMQGHIWLGEKEWCDFVSFCPEMPENKQLYIFRVFRDEKMIQQMEQRILARS